MKKADLKKGHVEFGKEDKNRWHTTLGKSPSASLTFLQTCHLFDQMKGEAGEDLQETEVEHESGTRFI